MGIKLTRVTNVLYRVLLSKHWFFLGFIVLFELTDSEWKPLDKQGCFVQQTPLSGLSLPWLHSRWLSPVEGQRYRPPGSTQGLSCPKLDPHYCSKLLHIGLRAASPTLHLRGSSQVDPGVLGHTTDIKAWQNIRKSEYFYTVLAGESILSYQFSQPKQNG